jgi:hypothetical protein
MGVDLRSVVSDFPDIHPASLVGIFRGALISLSSSLLWSAIGFVWFWLGDPSVLSSAIGFHRLLLPMVFQRFLLGVSTHLPRVRPFLSCALLASLVNLGSYGLRLVVQCRLRILPGCLLRRHLRSGMASESMNEVRFILIQRHRVPEQGENILVKDGVFRSPHPPLEPPFAFGCNVISTSCHLPFHKCKMFNIISDRTDFERH